MNMDPFNNLIFTDTLDGSTGAELFKNLSGRKWVVKKIQ